jgi:hypothetical protein
LSIHQYLLILSVCKAKLSFFCISLIINLSTACNGFASLDVETLKAAVTSLFSNLWALWIMYIYESFLCWLLRLYLLKNRLCLFKIYSGDLLISSYAFFILSSRRAFG